MKPESILCLIFSAACICACENAARTDAEGTAESSLADSGFTNNSSSLENPSAEGLPPPAVDDQSELGFLLDQYAALSPFESEMSEISALRAEIFQRITASRPRQIFAQAGHDELTLVTSADSTVFAVSLNQKTGGSLNPFETYIAFNSDSGTVFFPAGETLPGEIHRVEAHTYIMTDYLQFCGTCISARAVTFHADTAAFLPEVFFKYSGRSFDFTMRYDPVRRELHAEYTDPDYDDGMFTHLGDRFKHKEVYRFVDGAFILFDDEEIEVEQEPFDFGACGA